MYYNQHSIQSNLHLTLTEENLNKLSLISNECQQQQFGNQNLCRPLEVKPIENFNLNTFLGDYMKGYGDEEDANYFEDIVKNVILSQKNETSTQQQQQVENARLHRQAASFDSDESSGHLNHTNSTSSMSSKATDTTKVVKINEDDLIDQRTSMRLLFQNEFMDKFECRCDTSQGLFVTKYSKVCKSLQRKLANFYQLLYQHQLNKQNSQTSDDLKFELGNSQLTNDNLDKILAASNVAEDSNSSSEANAQEAINFILQNSQQNQDYKKKMFRSMRSIVERVLIDALMLFDQYQSQQQNEQANQAASSTFMSNPTTKLWCEVRNRGCQFLGPEMQDDVLKLILHALETVNRMSRKVLVLYVVHMLKKHYAKASKTSVGHVVQLLYRAGCFKVEKRENDSSLMELKKEFAKYAPLRRQHDAQIIQIALESGIRMSPEQWSNKLFGDASHKSEMQSIIDKLQSEQTLEKLIADFYDKREPLKYADMSINGFYMPLREDFEFFSAIQFEKKPKPAVQPVVSAANQLNKHNLDSFEKSHLNNILGSGGESDDEEFSSSADHDFDFLIDEDDDEFETNSTTDSRKGSLAQYEQRRAKTQREKHVEPEQTQIVWSLLNECLKRTIKILSTHMDYSSRMMNLIAASSGGIPQTNMQQTNNSTLNANKKMNSHYFNGGTKQLHVEANSGLNKTINSTLRTLIPMGPAAMSNSAFTANRMPTNGFAAKNNLNPQSNYNNGHKSDMFLNNADLNNQFFVNNQFAAGQNIFNGFMRPPMLPPSSSSTTASNFNSYANFSQNMANNNNNILTLNQMNAKSTNVQNEISNLQVNISIKKKFDLQSFFFNN